MKKIYLSLLSIALAFPLLANTYTVNVSNYSFAPDNFNVYVGDTIVWSRVNGSHTTTSTLVPGGALPWDAPLDENNEIFMYAVLVGGIYDYQCTPHYQSGMVGHFTALETSGIEDSESGIYLNIRSNPIIDQLHVDLFTRKSDFYTMTLSDITGREVRFLLNDEQSVGEHHYAYNVGDLAKGIYLLKFSSSETDVVRKVIID